MNNQSMSRKSKGRKVVHRKKKPVDAAPSGDSMNSANTSYSISIGHSTYEQSQFSELYEGANQNNRKRSWAGQCCFAIANFIDDPVQTKWIRFHSFLLLLVSVSGILCFSLSEFNFAL